MWLGDKAVLDDAGFGYETLSWAQFVEQVKPLIPQGGAAIGGKSAEDLLMTMLNKRTKTNK